MSEPVSPSGIVPIFPLPDVVFFPRTDLPLHIFEPRYRDMVRDALAGERLIVMALLRPGWEGDYLGTPPIFDVGTVGRLEDVVVHPDGRYDVRLDGLERVRLEEIESDRPYRLARVTPFPEMCVDDADPAVLRDKVDLLAANGCLLREISDLYQPTIVFDDRAPFEAAVNRCCGNLPVDPDVRQRLLEESDLRARQREVARVNSRVLESLLRIKARGGTAEYLLN